MSRRDPEAFRKYVRLIARQHGGLEGLKDLIGTKLQTPTSALEPMRAFEAAGGVELAAGPDRAGEHEENVHKATRALEAIEREQPFEPELEAGLEAIIVAELRPVIDVVRGTFTTNHPVWTKLMKADIHARLEGCMPAIGRIELPGNTRLPFGGTGFVVGNGLVMTNRHVAQIFTNGLGARSLVFKTGAAAGIDFIREFERPPGQVFHVSRVVMIHPYWDMAILAVEGVGERTALKLSLDDARALTGRQIAVVGYPAFDPRNPEDVQQDLLAGHFGVKRLQPGELQGAMKTASFQKLVNAATHDCSTLGGNSGSALIDLTNGTVLGLHFGGLYQEQNYAVPSFELARDQRVIDAGVSFAGQAKADATDWAQWWANADAGEAMLLASDADDDSQSAAPAAPTGGNIVAQVSAATAAGTLEVEIPIRISISVGAGRAGGQQVKVIAEAAGAGDVLEAMREPTHDTDYSTRKGYDPDFLNKGPGAQGLPHVSVPMPKAKSPSVLAKTKTGGDTLHYQNFSVRMHRQRRLALITASNVTTEPKLRKPEAGKDYTRKGLSGLGPNDTEKWFIDTRLDEQFQIPDVFFTKDRQAFDKGHIVRRDDVAWGSTYAALRRGNGDSYHVTNCSPQVKEFNQSAQGEDNWGDLENHVLSEAASERLCVFAGPVLDAQDRVFSGVGAGGVKLQSRIPQRFWKVIVARSEDGIAAYGFVLEQDLGDVQFEFTVSDVFAPAMYRLPDIAAMTGVSFAAALVDADQFESVRGRELAQRSGARRKHR